jgi:toxin ParE1/3/4
MMCRFSRQAELDLEEIGDFIALDSQIRALTFVRELREQCKKITNFPHGYPLAHEFGKDVRKLIYGQYLILYVVQMEQVEILHILHAARQRPKE